MLLNIQPLLRHRDYRLLFLGQFVSTMGSMMTYVALPYQIYHLTGSSFAVGLIGVVQLVPLLFTALVGGAYADSFDRRRLLLVTEALLLCCSAILAFNSALLQPAVWMIYVLAAGGSALSGFHRPAHGALMPRLVPKQDLAAMTALNSFSGTVCTVAGPAVAGILIASFGLPVTYFLDAVSFAAAMIAVLLLRPMPNPENANPPSLNSILEGLKYARSRPELLGTYFVDFTAMVFGMPMALFPAIAEGFGGAKVVGLLYSAPSVGALLVSLFSRWTARAERPGMMVVVAATLWGAAIIAFGFATNLWLALFLLGLAGGSDMVSALFRNIIWNKTIPDHLRGRLAGVEMVSYMSGPLLGNAESGLAAAIGGTHFSVVSGGLFCVVGVVVYSLRLPALWRYRVPKEGI